jgi:hypothetical protein
MFKPVIGLTRIAPILLALLFNPKPTPAQIPVPLNLNTAAPATPIPPDFLGLSFETLTLLPHADGTPAYFVPGNGLSSSSSTL